MVFGDKKARIDKLAEKEKSTKIVPMLKDKKKDVRLKAIEGLSKIGDDAAVNNLIIMLHDPDKEIRMATIKAMGEMGNNVTKTHLQHYIEKETDEELIEASRHSIAAISQVTDMEEEML